MYPPDYVKLETRCCLVCWSMISEAGVRCKRKKQISKNIMKGVNKLILILLFIGSQINFIEAQIRLSENDFNKQEDDSLLNVILKMQKERELHKDNKDSAWVNDLNGHTAWDSRAKSKEGKQVIIIDSITNNYYVLDSTHTIITAYNSSKQIIWKTNPRKVNHLSEYRHQNPVIIYYKIGKLPDNIYGSLSKKGEKVIFISYSNSQFGFLDLKTGKFTYEGQD